MGCFVIYSICELGKYKYMSEISSWVGDAHGHVVRAPAPHGGRCSSEQQPQYRPALVAVFLIVNKAPVICLELALSSSSAGNLFDLPLK